jgi:hypothetical protein
MIYFDVNKFTPQRVLGTTKIKVFKNQTVGWPWNRRVEEALSCTEEVPFDYPVGHADIPDKKICSDYRKKYTGTYPLVSTHYYTCIEKWAERKPNAFALLNFNGLSGVELPAICIGYKFDTTIDTPSADISFYVYKEEKQGWVEIVLTFVSRQQMQEYTTSLEPGESLVIAKVMKTA